MQRIGVIGAGQLGQMLGFAGRAMHLDFTYLDPAAQPPAAAAGRVIRRPFDDPDGLRQLAAASDIVTYEFENVPVASLDTIADQVPVYPPRAALQNAQDRLAEKRLFAELDIPVPEYRRVDSQASLEDALRQLGVPLVLKTRRFGYDGKGQYVLRTQDDIDPAWRQLGGKPLIAEQWVPFEREVSAIGARSTSGEIGHYPLTENRHADGILRDSRAPFRQGSLTDMARDYMERLLSKLDYVGVLALELFVADGELRANEYAPRVHNSGHWTIDGAITSQFENHLRAILDLPLGDCSAAGFAGMRNLIGCMPADPEAIAATPAILHDYGKKPRPGRKLGHINVAADTADERDARMKTLENQLAA